MHRTRPGGLNGGEMYGTRAGLPILLLLRSIFNHCDIIGLEIYRIRRKKTNKGYYAVQGHSRSAYCSNFGHCVFEPPLGEA